MPLLIGSNEDEGTLFSMLLPADISDDEVIAALPETIVDPRPSPRDTRLVLPAAG